MLAKVIIENGQKKIQALTADTGTGAPVGSYLYLEKKSNPQGYLFCDGSTFDETTYPALYQYLGSNVLPDWREFSAVGAEQNTTSSVIATHDVFAQGEAKDDQLQDHVHMQKGGFSSGDNTLMTYQNYSTPTGVVASYGVDGARKGTVTRGKSRAVFIYIKATSGLTENQQENVLNTINENLSYSTEEHPTGKKWIDGKPIYRKVVNFGALPNNTTKSVATGISNLENLISLTGTSMYGSTVLTMPYVDLSDVTHGIGFYYNLGNIYIVTGIDWSRFDTTYVVLEYTKTTD